MIRERRIIALFLCSFLLPNLCISIEVEDWHCKAEICANHPTAWKKKCHWRQCATCSQCDSYPEPVLQCKPMCMKSTESWEKRCNWLNNCGSCQECGGGTRTHDTQGTEDTQEDNPKATTSETGGFFNGITNGISSFLGTVKGTSQSQKDKTQDGTKAGETGEGQGNDGDIPQTGVAADKPQTGGITQTIANGISNGISSVLGMVKGTSQSQKDKSQDGTKEKDNDKTSDNKEDEGVDEDSSQADNPQPSLKGASQSQKDNTQDGTKEEESEDTSDNKEDEGVDEDSSQADNPQPNSEDTNGPLCKDYCEDRNVNWIEKCQWKSECDDCVECFTKNLDSPEKNPSCKDYCHTNRARWIKKCELSGECDACEECDNLEDPPEDDEDVEQPIADLSGIDATTPTCEFYCINAWQDWSDKCLWPGQCDSCEQCSSNQYNPSAACRPQCVRNIRTWKRKCRMNGRCNGCAQCVDPNAPANCRIFCETHEAEWSSKCSWRWCNGCPACSEGV